MKKLLIIIVAVFTFTSITTAQELTSAPTTETEYNYITKGYKVQIESGLDMKSGYTLGDIEKVEIGNYTFEIKALIRDGKNEIAALMVITHSAAWDNTYYFCIPHGNSELYKKYYDSLVLWDKDILTAYSYLMSSKLGELAAEAYEMEKQLQK